MSWLTLLVKLNGGIAKVLTHLVQGIRAPWHRWQALQGNGRFTKVARRPAMGCGEGEVETTVVEEPARGWWSSGGLTLGILGSW